MLGMGKSFLPDDVNQSLLFPPSLHDWLPENHLARFLVDVVSALDLSAIYASYEAKDGRGQSAYAPAMMVRVLLYGYATGVYSSRKMEAKTYDDVAFRYLSADAHPDHDTIAEFRKRHLEALAGLFTQALLLCEKAGLVKLGHVSIDGTKIKANASKHKAMSYARMGETEQRLKAEIEALLKQAEDVDAAEDAQYGKGKRGDELPEELARRESRLKKIAQAKAELEQEAREKAERERAEAEAKLAERRDEQERTGKKKRGREPQVPDPGSGATGRQGAAQLHRSGEPHHARRSQQGQLRAGLQRAGGSGLDGAGNRGRGGHARDHGQPPTAADVRPGGSRTWAASRRRPAPMRVTGARPMRRMKAWRASICISPRDARNTKKLSRQPASRRRSRPRPRKRCGTNCAPRPGDPFTRCARRSSSRSSDRSRSSEASGASACAAWRMFAASGSWCA